MADEHCSAHGSSHFSYKPLSDPSKSLRLIYILPGTSIDQISLRMVNVDNPVKYTQLQGRSNNRGWVSRSKDGQYDRKLRPGCYRCLSYMWGDANEEFEIIVNGHPFLIRKNLLRFLDCARGKIYQNALWIDALCINQDDLSEKSHQVQRMGQIFEDAQEVLIWLGDGPELYSIYAALQRGTKISSQDTAAVVQNPYWKRAWIVQEFLLARELRIVGSFGDCDWNDFNIESRGVDSLEITNLWVERHNIRISSNSRRLIDLCDILARFPTRLCSNLRDRIYSLLGVVYSGRSFDVDYAEDVSSLFWRAGEQFRVWGDIYHLSGLLTALELTETMLRTSIASGAKEYTTTVSVELIDWTPYHGCTICDAYAAATKHYSCPRPGLEQLDSCGVVVHLNDIAREAAPGHIHLVPNIALTERGDRSMDVIFSLSSRVRSADVRLFLLESNAFEYRTDVSWAPLHKLSDLLATLKASYLNGDADFSRVKPCLWNWEDPNGASFRVRLQPYIVLAIVRGITYKDLLSEFNVAFINLPLPPIPDVLLHF